MVVVFIFVKYFDVFYQRMFIQISPLRILLFSINSIGTFNEGMVGGIYE